MWKADDTATWGAPVFTEPWVFLLGAYCHMGASPDNTVEACLFSRYTRRQLHAWNRVRNRDIITSVNRYRYKRAASTHDSHPSPINNEDNATILTRTYHPLDEDTGLYISKRKKEKRSVKIKSTAWKLNLILYFSIIKIAYYWWLTILKKKKDSNERFFEDIL